MAGINTNNTQWGNFQSDDIKNLNDIYRWIKKLETVISAGGFTGGWTDAGATVKLTTATDSVGIGTASTSSKLHVLHDANAVAIFESSTDSYAKIQSGNNLDAVLLLTDGTDEGSIAFGGATGTLMIDAGGDGIEIAASGVVTIPNLGGSGTGVVAVSNTGVLGFTGIGSNTQVLFNDSGAIAGDSGLIFNKATNKLSVDGIGIWSKTTNSVGIGVFNTTWTGTGNTLINTSATSLSTGSNNVFIGSVSGLTSTGSSNLHLGAFSSGDNGNFSGTIALNAQDGGINGSNQMVIGGSTPFEVTEVTIGNGKQAATPASVSINASGGAGNNIAGANITIAGGKPTGSGAGGHVIIQTAAAGASGTTLRSLSTIAEFTDDAKIGFFGVTPVVRQTELTDELTTITHSAPGTPDYAIQDLVAATGFGFVTSDEAQTVLSVIANLQARVNELETKLTAYGLLIDAD